MRRRTRLRLAERSRRLRRGLAVWRRRDPSTWILVLAGMALGLGIFLWALTLAAALRLGNDLAKWLR